MAHSRFVNAFSRISKDDVFRFKIFCFVFVVGVVVVMVVVCVWGGGGRGRRWGASGTLFSLQCTHSKVKFKGNNFHTMRSFVLVIKNNEAVLAIKWPAAPNNKLTCAQSETSNQPRHPPGLASLRCPTDGSLGHQLPIQRTMETLIRLGDA